MQITIIGAGIAGLSAYLFLSKHLQGIEKGTYKIRIYETYDAHQNTHEFSDNDSIKGATKELTPDYKTIGVAVGISKNGLAVLGRIDDDGDVLRQVKRRGNCISTWRMGTARGWKLIDAVVASSPGEKGDRDEKSQPTVMIARQVVWEILRDKVLEIDKEAIVTAKVVEVYTAANGKVTIKLEGGAERMADLVIGADGLRSVVRKAIFEDTKDLEPQAWWERLLGRQPQIKDYITPEFVGLTGVGGTLPPKVLKDSGFQSGAMAITFGPNGFFGHGYFSPVEEDSEAPDPSAALATKTQPLAGWWSTFSSPTPYPFQKDNSESNDSDSRSNSSSDTKPLIIDQDATIQNLCARHRTWKDPTIQAILDYVYEHKDDTLIHTYPTYTTPELPTWHNTASTLVLIGDAAHALQPSSGQGACQALEDAETLSLLLGHYLRTTDNNTSTNTSTTQPNNGIKQNSKPQSPAPSGGIANALTAFDTLRRPRLAKIYEQSSKFGKMKSDMNVVQEMIMYLFIWLGSRLGGGGIRRYNEELWGYDLVGEVDRVIKGRVGDVRHAAE